ncbi:MAG TPA: SDR family oxidoreductase [Candidatus Saccharimonadales bacterium]
MKTILITGSSRGVGKAIAVLAHQRNYKVVIHGKTDSAELRQTHKELGGSFKVFFDVSDKALTHKAIARIVKKIGNIDVLVNNSGVTCNFLQDIQEVDDSKAIEEYKVNVLGTLHCIQAVLPNMLESGQGCVINVSSIKGYANLATLSTLTYAPTKAGVISITKALAKAYPTVRFNVIAPGYIETDQAKDWSEETFDRIKNGTILGRTAKPAEIAPVVLFLASHEATYITGADFLVDGGYSIKGK